MTDNFTVPLKVTDKPKVNKRCTDSTNKEKQSLQAISYIMEIVVSVLAQTHRVDVKLFTQGLELTLSKNTTTVNRQNTKIEHKPNVNELSATELE